MPFLVPILVGVALIGAGSEGALALTFFGLSLSLSSGTLIGLGASLVLNGVSKLLQKKPASASVSVANRTTTVRQAIAPRQVIYGRAGKLGGVFTFIDLTTVKTTNDTLHLVITMSGHRIQSFDQMYFDGNLVPLDGDGNATGPLAGYVHIEFNLGSDSQPAFPGLVAADPTKWTSAHRQAGCAGVYVQLTFSSLAFPNGVPNITFDVHGKNDVYDPRTATSGYTENAALCIRDYMLNSRWGISAATSEMDDVQNQAAANVCDEPVTLLAGGTEPRYAVNGIFTTDQLPSDVIASMLSACAGRIVFVGGLFGIFPGAYVAADVFLDESDIRGPIQVVTSAQKTDLFNGVRGVFISPDAGWVATDFPSYQDVGFVAEDSGEEIWKDVQLQFTISAATAQRLAKVELERVRRQKQVTLPCKLTAYQAKALTVVGLSIARYGWVNKTFEVVDLKFASVTGTGSQGPALGIDLVLQEVDSAIFDWNPATDEKPVNVPTGTVTLPGARPGTPTHTTASQTGKPAAGQTFASSSADNIVFPADFAGSTMTMGTPPSTTYNLEIHEFFNADNGDALVGYLTIRPDGSYTFSTTDLNADGQDDLVFMNAGDFVYVICPNPQDATLSDISINFVGKTN